MPRLWRAGTGSSPFFVAASVHRGILEDGAYHVGLWVELDSGVAPLDCIMWGHHCGGAACRRLRVERTCENDTTHDVPIMTDTVELAVLRTGDTFDFLWRLRGDSEWLLARSHTIPGALVCGIGFFAKNWSRPARLAAEFDDFRFAANEEVTLGEQFRRGDANADGRLDIGDAVHLLNHLFSGVARLTCLKAGDSNDDGRLDIGDPIGLLAYLFGGGFAPPTPFTDCGLDPTPDELDCERFPPCR
jgi:hypothetical protein